MATPAVLNTTIPAPVLYHGDCMEVMKQFPDKSVDLILNDPPFGCTGNKWDTVLPLDEMWAEYKRILKPNGVVVMFGSGNLRDSKTMEPFVGKLMMSNPKDFKYSLVYLKHSTNPALASWRPLKKHEDILVFCEGQMKDRCTYNPQMESRKGNVNKNTGMTGDVYPGSVLPLFPRETGIHPTQKPVGLMEWLVKTYSNIGDTVLDNTMGSGSTGVAAVRLKRAFIGIEADDTYFPQAKERIEKAVMGTLQEDLELDAAQQNTINPDDVELPALSSRFDAKEFKNWYAKTFIDQDAMPPEDSVSVVVRHMNRYFAVIHGAKKQVVEYLYNGDKIVDYQFRSESQANARLGKCMVYDEDGKRNNLYAVWSRHIDSTEFFGTVFSPKPVDDPEKFNTFYGVRAQKEVAARGMVNFDEAAIQPLLTHIYDLAGQDDFYYNYLLDWMAYPLQTGEKTQVAVVLRGEPGCGKSVIFETLMTEHIYGVDLATHIATGRSLTDKFNAHFNNKLLITVDEPNALSKAARNMLKNNITSAFREVRAMYQDPVIADDFANYAFTCNTIPADMLDHNDRRFLLLEHKGDHVGDKAYTDMLRALVKERYLDFYLFLKARTIETFVLGKPPPQTELKERMRVRNVDPVWHYIRHLIETGELPGRKAFTLFLDETLRWFKTERFKPSFKDRRELKDIINDAFPEINCEDRQKISGKTAVCIRFPDPDVMRDMMMKQMLWLKEEELKEDDDIPDEHLERLTIRSRDPTPAHSEPGSNMSSAPDPRRRRASPVDADALADRLKEEL